MVLTFAEDFSSEITLDSELIGTSESGLYFNRGVHPAVTVDNILSLLPSTTITFSNYNSETTYTKYEDSRKRSDIVVYDGNIYQSLADSNVGNLVSDSTFWLQTNLESLRIKSAVYSAKDNMISAISLNRKLIENQFIYDVGKTAVTIGNDYSGWVFEPKGSDYVKIRINQIAIQTTITGTVILTIINQGQIIGTLPLTSSGGVLSFTDVGYTIYGKGKFYFVFESQEVLSEQAFNDPLKYDGFVCYPVSGIGASPESSVYSTTNYGNGMGFNITAYLDSDLYIENNLVYLAKLYQSQFEVDFIRTIVSNANAQSNNVQRILSEWDKRMLAMESTDLEHNTVARRYQSQLRNAKAAINRSFDNFVIDEETGFEVTIGTI